MEVRSWERVTVARAHLANQAQSRCRSGHLARLPPDRVEPAGDRRPRRQGARVDGEGRRANGGHAAHEQGGPCVLVSMTHGTAIGCATRAHEH